MKTIRPSDQDFGAKTTTPSPMDRTGERESVTAPGEAPAYGEPRGPRPPHFTTLPKAEIDRRARAARPNEVRPRYEGSEREVEGFHSGMTTPETRQTTGDQSPKVIKATEQREDDDGGGNRRS